MNTLRDRSPVRRGVTLIEVLIVVTLLGLAGAMVIPSMRHVGVLRIQAAVRTVVGDITFMQSEALARQSRYIMVFGKVVMRDEDGLWQVVDGEGYTIFAPPPGAAALDVASTVDVYFDPLDHGRPMTRDFTDEEFAGARIDNFNINGGNWLIFDELGGPVLGITGDDPGAGGTFRIIGDDSTFQINIEAFTGRVEVARIDL